MMKKLLLFVVTIALAFGTGPAMAAQFEIDLWGGSTGLPAGKTFDTSIDIGQGDTVMATIWVTGITDPLIGYIDTQFNWDTSSVALLSVDNSNLTPPWDGAPFALLGPGQEFLEVIMFTGGQPGPDIEMHTLELQCTQGADPRIQSLISVDSGGGSFDWGDENATPIQPYPTAGSATLNQGPPPPCTCDVTPDSPAPIIGSGSQQFSAAPISATCNTPQYVWSDNCTQGSVDAAGLFTSDDPIAALETCTITATDIANTQDQTVCTEDIDLVPASGCATKIYRGGVCDEADPLDTVYNRPGRRGLSITCCEYEQFCICSSCDEETCFAWTATKIDGDPDFDPATDLVADAGTGDSFMLKVADPCTDHCPDKRDPVTIEVCVEGYDCAGAPTGIADDCVIVQIGAVAIGLGDTNAHPDTQTTDIDLLLWNFENHVKAISTDICGCDMAACGLYTTEADCGDETCGLIQDSTGCGAAADCQWKTVGGVDKCVNAIACDYIDGACVARDNLVCTECVVDEDRSAEFYCSANEQANGCCRVTLYTTEPDDLIQQGEGAIAKVKFDVGDGLTTKDCACLIPANIDVADQFNEPLCACPRAGEICFRICGDVYPQDCYECASCGDGVVDLFDILEEIDFILKLQTPTDCQLLHGDVPLGMPPYCGDPAGVTPPNCETDGVIDIFDALVIIDKALSRMNCCDYCMYGQIY